MSFDEFSLAETHLVDDAPFFAPTDSDVIDRLLGEYQSTRADIEQLCNVFTAPKMARAMQYCLDGAKTDRYNSISSVEQLFQVGNAISKLNSKYWGDALSLTDVYDCMPQARRDYWNAQLRGDTEISGKSWERREKIPPLPDFEEATVRNTLADLLRQRATFFSERVDGIFRGLSGEHVTNSPAAFGKRMIISGMIDYNHVRSERAGLINDLRCVIAKFMGRDDPKYAASHILCTELYRRTGQWVTVDGGALKIRVYKKGTAHMEVHPDMAWRLNQVLASLYPLAIPAEFRAMPKKRAKDFVMMGRPLPFATLELLSFGLDKRNKAPKVFEFGYKATENKAAYSDACNVLTALGGLRGEGGEWSFGYPIEEILRHVVITGCLPDQKAHQFYPTPEKLALKAVALADIQPGDTCLEPSAGQGGIADYMPKDQTTCVEISPLHCAVLKAKGFDVVEADFLPWAMGAPKFDAIVMNPPYSEGRAKLHTEYAAALVKPGGRLVSILPASMRGKDFLSGFDCDWTSAYEREFAGTSMAVTILKATKK